MKRNLVVAVIIIVLFLVLAMVGFGIYAIQNSVSLFKRRASSSDDGDD